MLQTLDRMEKMAVLQRKLRDHSLLEGSTSSFFARMKAEEQADELDDSIGAASQDHEKEEDVEPVSGNAVGAMSDVKLAIRQGELAVPQLLLPAYY